MVSNHYSLRILFMLYKIRTGKQKSDIEVFQMKSLRLLSLVSGILLLFASVALGAPNASVDRPVFDFGTVAQGKRVDHVFSLKNKGDAVLTIGQVSTSCGCTVADVSTRTVAPGKSAEIRVSFNSANFSGSVSKSITIQTNDPKAPTYSLIMKGKVFEEISVNPKQLNLGEIRIGTRKDTSLTVENSSKKPLTLTSIKSTMPQVLVKTKSTKVKAGGNAVISISVTPRKDDRFLGGYITINTNSPEKPEIIIPVYASATR